MELPTKQNKRIEEAAQKIQDLYFDNGATVNVETWEKTLNLLPSLVRSIVMDALPPQNEEPHIAHEVPIETPDKKNYLVYCSQWNSYRRAFLDNLEKQGI